MPQILKATEVYNRITEKTIDYDENRILRTPMEYDTPGTYTLPPSKEMSVTAVAGVYLILGTAPYEGYQLPITSKGSFVYIKFTNTSDYCIALRDKETVNMIYTGNGNWVVESGTTFVISGSFSVPNDWPLPNDWKANIGFGTYHYADDGGNPTTYDYPDGADSCAITVVWRTADRSAATAQEMSDERFWIRYNVEGWDDDWASFSTSSGSETLTNKTISYNDNTLTGVQPTITGAATSIISSDLTASKALVSDASGKVAASSVTSTELGYVSGVTSSIQNQINSKQATLSQTQLNAVNSGIDSTKVGQIATNTTDIASKANDNAVVHIAGSGNTPEEITGVKSFTYGHGAAQDDNNPGVRASRLRIIGQVAPSTSQKSVSQVDFYLGDENLGYMGCTKQNNKAYLKVASANKNIPLIFGYLPYTDNTSCLRFEQAHPVWRGGQTGTWSEDKNLAIVGHIKTGTYTITNKTIAFSSNTLTGVASTDTAQTLTNKTINGADNTLTISPTVISATPSSALAPTKMMNLVIDTANITLALGDGPYDGYELPILAQEDCTISFTGVGGATSMSMVAGAKVTLTWNDTYWRAQSSEAITGIDDNGQPFAFNIDSLAEPGGVINITGKDANGNSFDYGLGKLVVAADEDNYSTSEVKTSKTWIDGKPIYRKVFQLNTIVTNAWTTFDDDTTHILINVCGRIGQYFIPFSQVDASTYWFVVNNRTYKCGAGMANYTGYIIAEYTKTTD